MKPTLRHFAVLALSMTLFAPAALGQFTPLKQPSPTGSFLAGQQAMAGLDTPGAVRHYEDAAERAWNNPLVINQTFQALIANGEIEGAASLAQHLLDLMPQTPLAPLVTSTVALKQRSYGAAIADLQRLEEQSFLGITASILRAWAYVGDNKFAQADEIMNRLAGEGLEDFLIYHRLLMADVADRRDAALAYAEEAYGLDPFDVRFAEAYIRLLGNAGRFEEALAVMDQYELEGFDEPLVSTLRAPLEAGKRPGKLAKNAQAGAAELFYSVGSVLSQEGAPDVPVMFLRLGLYLEPRSNIASLELARLYERAGQFEIANEIYNAVPSDAPLKGRAIVRIAQNYDNLGDREDAILRLRDLIEQEPENLEAVFALGDLLRFDERYDEAEVAYTRALEITDGTHPRDWIYYYMRGICRERLKTWELAEADFLKALELNPGHPQVLNYLGYSWIDQGMHLERALEMIQQAIEWNPSDGYVVDSLGWAYYKLGRMEEAVQTLESAVQLQPGDATINDHLGDAYWQVGRKLEARFQWGISLDIEPDGEFSEATREKLANGMPEVEPAAADAGQETDAEQAGV